jgi:hypothetical protein
MRLGEPYGRRYSIALPMSSTCSASVRMKLSALGPLPESSDQVPGAELTAAPQVL